MELAHRSISQVVSVARSQTSVMLQVPVTPYLFRLAKARYEDVTKKAKRIISSINALMPKLVCEADEIIFLANFM